MKALFQCTQAHWFEQVNFPQWNGLTIVSIDGVSYRTPDSDANDGAFKILQNTQYARVRSSTHVLPNGASSHLVTASAFDYYRVYAKNIGIKIYRSPDNSPILFDKGFHSHGSLHQWLSTVSKRHWFILLNKKSTV